MYQLKDLEDTIVAISTPSGQGGIGIVRLSGEKAVAIADRIFKPKAKVKPSKFRSHTVHYGWVKNGQETIDEALLTIMRAPNSYTKEDVIELSCHGGMVSLRAIMALALEYGARLAEPGEFTKRAFLNGRIDLTQAEAVLDIIQSKTDAFLKVSTHQLKGELSRELEEIRAALMNIYVEIEAIVNFPEDEVDARGNGNISGNIDQAVKRIERLLSTADHGKILKEGVKIVLCGKPNVGKSSLLNVLLKQPRAIVSQVAGTTRDTIEETAQIRGIPFQLVDTAGVLEPRDLIEEEAVKRSHMYMENADLVLLVLDASQALSPEDEIVIDKIKGQNVLAVLNKCDLKKRLDVQAVRDQFSRDKVVEVSALSRQGMEKLESSVIGNVWHQKQVHAHGPMVSNIRHVQALKEAKDLLKKSRRDLDSRLSLEFISESIKGAVNCLDNITGRNIDHDLLDTIFSQFCIGK